MIKTSDDSGVSNLNQIINNNYLIYEAVDFEGFLFALGLKKDMISKGDWREQETGVLVKPMITDDLSKEYNLTYIGLIFNQPTNAHYYKTREDTILFKTPGKVDFLLPGRQKPQTHYFQPEEAIQIPRYVVRQLSPIDKTLEIELVVKPRYKESDEIPVKKVA